MIVKRLSLLLSVAATVVHAKDVRELRGRPPIPECVEALCDVFLPDQAKYDRCVEACRVSRACAKCFDEGSKLPLQIGKNCICDISVRMQVPLCQEITGSPTPLDTAECSDVRPYRSFGECANWYKNTFRLIEEECEADCEDCLPSCENTGCEQDMCDAEDCEAYCDEDLVFSGGSSNGEIGCDILTNIIIATIQYSAYVPP